MGRVLLAELSPAQLAAIVPERLEPRTEHTVATGAELEAVLADVRRQGWALVDEELEVGLRSLAAPSATPRAARWPP